MSSNDNPNKKAITRGKKSDLKNDKVLSCYGKDHTYSDLFNLVNSSNYNTSGKDCDWLVIKVYDIKNKCDGLAVLFQGSSSNHDWFRNFQFLPIYTKAYKGWEHRLKYHKGWFKEYDIARDDIINAIRKEFKEGMTIFSIGFSLGGALAQIASEDINYHFKVNPILISYEGGNPCANLRTRNKLLNSINLEQSVIFEFASDFVPKLPPFFWRLNDIKCHLGRRFGLIDAIKNTKWYHVNCDVGIEQCCKKGD